MNINIINTNLIYLYLLLINLITFTAFGIDKYKAKKRSWRIPEANLLMLSFLGGALGGIIGMYSFKHKTQKLKFTIIMPIMLILHIYFLFKI